MENNRTRRPQSPGIPPPSLGLVRSKSRSSPAASITFPENNNTSQRSHIIRSKSVTNSRTKKDEENVNPITLVSSKGSFAKFLQRGSKTGGGSKASSPTPSAWALSPGRSIGSPLAPPTPPECVMTEGIRRGKSSSGDRGGVSGVFRFFRQKKKASSVIQEDEFHHFRIMQNRLLQWRIANLRAETSMANVKSLTEDSLFSLWLQNLRMRNRMVESRIDVQKMRNEIKMYKILFPQITLLNQWVKMDKRNQESMGNLTYILSTLSLKLPVLQGAKVEMVAFQQSMSTAMEVMAKIEATITKDTLQQVEKMLYMLTERLSIFKEQEEWLEKLEKTICLISMLVTKENGVRVQLMEATKAGRNGPIT